MLRGVPVKRIAAAPRFSFAVAVSAIE
jgi:hypothetical protein